MVGDDREKLSPLVLFFFKKLKKKNALFQQSRFVQVVGLVQIAELATISVM